MGSVIPPSKKAIIGMTTSPTSPSVRMRSVAQYYRATPCRIQYLALKLSIAAEESTKYLTYPFKQMQGTLKKFFRKRREPRRLVEEKTV